MALLYLGEVYRTAAIFCASATHEKPCSRFGIDDSIYNRFSSMSTSYD